MKTAYSLKVLFLLVMLTFATGLMAQKKTLAIFRTVQEVTETPIVDAQIVILYEGRDTVPYKDTKMFEEEMGIRSLEFEFRRGKYTLIARKEGYEDAKLDFAVHTGRNTVLNLDDVAMKKSARKLKEVVVNATRIKLVTRGDTLIYDAAAFELAEGSMLDALVAQLPGATLKDGQITVNGKPIESLIVNGENFFEGNPKVALENLPAYTVNSIKVYDRAPDDAYITRRATKGKKRPDEAEHLVMDVVLKKAYSTGWMGNAEAGMGVPDSRYAGKLFGLGYTDRLRLTVYGNANNISNTQSASQSGEWRSGWEPDGVLRVEMGGMDYFWKGGKHKMRGNVMLTHERPEVEQRTSSVNFFQTDNVYSRQLSRSNEEKVHLITYHLFQHQGKQLFWQVYGNLDWMKNDRSSLTRSATFNAEPQEAYRLQSLDSIFAPMRPTASYAAQLLQRYQQEKVGRTGWTKATFEGRGTLDVPRWGDNMHFYAFGRYERDHDNPLISTHRAYGEQSALRGTGENLLQRQAWEANKYTFIGSATYNFMVVPYVPEGGHYGVLSPQLRYSRDYHRDYNDFWQLREHLQGNSWGKIVPPSAIAPEVLTQDLNNSVHSTVTEDKFEPALSLGYAYYADAKTKKGVELSLNFSPTWRSQTLDYHRHALDTLVSRWKSTLEGRFSFELHQPTERLDRDFQLGYGVSEALPSIFYELGTTSDSDPTNIFVNRPGLRKSLQHQVQGNIRYFWKESHQSITLYGTYSRTDRAVAMARRYDRNTGVSIWTPDNIDGNWNAFGSLQLSKPFGKDEAFQLNTTTSGYYVNSVDFTTERLEPERSEVRNFTLQQDAELTYRIHKQSFGVRGGVKWLRSRSDLASFTPISALDYSARANALLHLPKDFELSTDLNFYARRGYNDANLNTTHWVWNASLSKALLKQKLTLKLTTVDLLNEISTVTYAVNAQGRTETWVNAMPHYVMLSAIYKLNLLPKKK